MLAYGRTSAITGLKYTLVGGVGDTEVSGTGMAGKGGVGFGMTGQGGVRDGESRPGVGAEGDIPEGRYAESSWSKVGVDDGMLEGDGAGLSVEAGWGVSCATVSTQLAPLEIKPGNCFKLYSAASLSKPTVNRNYLGWQVQNRTFL